MEPPPASMWWKPPNQRPQNVVLGGKQARFQVLSASCVRMEYHEDGDFEDAPSYTFVNRNMAPEADRIFVYTQKVMDNKLVIETECIRVTYRGPKFDHRSLKVELIQGKSVTWRFGWSTELESQNLLGTLRTLDVQATSKRGLLLQQGLLSRAGFTVVDDSRTLVFDERGWIRHRKGLKESRVATVGVEPSLQGIPESYDLYFFAYGTNYLHCLREFAQFSGAVPLMPLHSFGLTWSKHWPYKQDELIELVEEFERHGMPLAALCIDMDWHLNGWTGYSWNKELLPNPAALLRYLNNKNVKVALNLHPADGCGAHEAAYEEFSKFMGIGSYEPTSLAAERAKMAPTPIPFDIKDPQYMEGYFRFLHRPLEHQGISFWWIDWQQGSDSGMVGLDPLAWLNHLHWHDLRRNGRRAYILSRWAGLGNQRYQLGFSGDTVASWKYLQMLPCFTATASNVLFNWSHDTGGFHWGSNDPELYVRWFQFAALSPTLRLHSTRRRFEQRLPWGFDLGVEAIVRAALQLRRSLMPYIYSSHYLQHKDAQPLIGPSYIYYPTEESAYVAYNQYFLGTELLVCPYLEPRNAEARLSRTAVWIPPGRWFEFNTGVERESNRWTARWGTLDECCYLMAPAGAIIPLEPLLEEARDTDIVLVVFPFGSRSTVLYEDDGQTNAHETGAYDVTSLATNWDEKRRRMRLSMQATSNKTPPSQGKETSKARRILVKLRGLPRGVVAPAVLEVAKQKSTLPVTLRNGDHCVSFSFEAHESVRLTFKIAPGEQKSQLSTLTDAHRILQAANAPATISDSTYSSIERHLDEKRLPWVPTQPEPSGQALLETLCGVGYLRMTHQFSNRDFLILWNYCGDQRFYYVHDSQKRFVENKCEVLVWECDAPLCLVTVHYDTLTKVVHEFGRKAPAAEVPKSPRSEAKLTHRISRLFGKSEHK